MVDNLPAEIQLYLNNLDEPKRLLQAASLSHFYNQAGQMASKDEKLKPDLIQEEITFANDALNRILSDINGLPTKNNELLIQEWLRKVKAHNQIIHPKNVLDLIKQFANARKITKQLFLEVCGETGKQLLRYLPEINFKEHPVTNTWHEGSSESRLAFITELRQTDSMLALSLIQETWDKESIAFKRNLLTILQKKPCLAEVNWVQQKLETEFVFTAQETKSINDCRYLSTSIVLQLNASNLYQDTLKHFRAYVGNAEKSIFKKIFGGKPAAAFNLPIADDAFFNADYLFQNYGIEKQNKRSQFFSSDNLYRLSEFVQLLPLSFWMDLLGSSKESIIDNFLTAPQYQVMLHGQSLPCLAQALAHSAMTFRDAEHIFIQLNHKANIVGYEMAKFLPQDQQEQLAVQQDLFMNDQFLQWIGSEQAQWSESFSKRFIQKTYDEMIGKSRNIFESWVNQYTNNIHYNALPLLDQLAQKDDGSPYKEMWISNVYRNVKAYLEIKNKLQNI